MNLLAGVPFACKETQALSLFVSTSLSKSAAATKAAGWDDETPCIVH